MAEQTNTKRSQALHAAFNQNRYDDILALAADDIEAVAYAIGQTFQGKQAFRDFFMAFKTAMPDIAIQPTNTMAVGDQVVIEFVAVGTHTGPLMMPNGAVPASGNRVSLSVVEIHAWKDGKLRRMVNYQDAMSLLMQVGALGAPAGL